MSVIEYDRLFRQAAARDRTMRWDSPKEDIYVWALTQPSLSGSIVHGGRSFRDRAPITARLGPPVKHNPLTSDRAPRMPSGKEICKRFILGKCTRGEDCVFAHKCWYSNCRATTLARSAQNAPELQRGHTPRYSQFERELVHHPDKAFTSKLLTALQQGVDIGYKSPIEAKNLPSALHTHLSQTLS